jgi:zinc transport system substrate-binding protein
MKRLLSFFGLLLLTGCMPAPATDTGNLHVVATFYPMAYIAERIGQQHVTVTQITPSGIEPHEYEPTPQDLAKISSADIFLLNGRGMDPWAERIRPELEKGDIRVVDATPVGTVIPDDPHTWLDPLLFRHTADDVLQAFVEADPTHAQEYRGNAESLVATLNTLNEEYVDGLRQCVIREIIVSHDAFQYLARRYNFTAHAVSGLSPEEEPSAKRIGELATLAKSKNIDTVFFETLVDPKLAETIASEVGAKTAVLNPVEGLIETEITTGMDYAAIMYDNLSALRKAMKCQ